MFKLLNRIFSTRIHQKSKDVAESKSIEIERHCNRAKSKGNEMLARGKLDDAAACYLQALAINPQDIEGHINLGYVFSEQKRYFEAVYHLEQALDIAPENVDCFFMLGNLLLEQGNFDDAQERFEKVLSLKPGYDISYRALLNLKRYDEAKAACDAILRIDQHQIDALVNRGFALQLMNRLDEAIIDFERSSAIEPKRAELHMNLGSALSAVGKTNEALLRYDLAIFLDPNLADAHFNASLCRLQIGEYEGGWQGHEWRWKTKQLAKSMRNFPQPLWLGNESLEGKTILLHAEQGLGDSIQFCRYARLVAARGAKVLLLVQDALVSLLKDLDGVSTVVIDGQPFPPFDFHCPLMSLPLALQTRLDMIDARVPYIKVSDAHVARWREKLPDFSGLRVGLVWSGNEKHQNDHNRSIALARFDILARVGVEFVSLQKVVRDNDVATLNRNKEIIHFGDKLANFTDTASLICNLDLVISVDTSVAHLAAALGKPVWLILPFTSDWRWLKDRNDSPWYPTVRLFRQTIPGDWPSVFKALVTELDILQIDRSS